ncbi:MAG: hypothetical protein JST04_00795 [Bdellovibrionales bacterium]|nr:hypothetical protein [Bdellovibrionales bacterium]
MIKAEIIADSENEFGNRITTMRVVFPRYILAELNTHRMLSKNSASSRAIPFQKLLQSVKENPFIPIAWQKDHSGMQGSEYFTDKEDINYITKNWLLSRDFAVQEAENLSSCGVTKQLVNRLLEPFMYHTVLITATEWENFFSLRCPQYEFTFDHTDTKIFRSRKDLIRYGASYHKDKYNDILFWLQLNKGMADIHMIALAETMWDAYNESTPKKLNADDWHIPFEDTINLSDLTNTLKELNGEVYENMFLPTKIKISTAMCARTSYTVIGEEGKRPNLLNDIKLHDRLSLNGHWSCFEHCAKSMNQIEYNEVYNSINKSNGGIVKDFGWSGNFRGFIQYRKMFANENITVNGK